MPKLKDLTGQFFGFLEVIEKDWEKSKEKIEEKYLKPLLV